MNKQMGKISGGGGITGMKTKEIGFAGVKSEWLTNYAFYCDL